MFRNRKEDEFTEEGAPAQGSLLGSNGAGTEEPAQSAAPQAASTTAPISGYQVSAPSRAVSDPVSRPQSALPTALNPFRSAPVTEPRRPTETKASSFTGAPAERSKDSRRVLTVGSDILLKGEIATCDRLVIEGKVDAVLNDVGTVELAESGSFKGVAQVENAEISGLFEGELVVKGRLVIYASGRVRGKITYGEIEIERGGELTGDIKTIASSTQARRTERATTATKEEKEKAEAA